MTFFSFRLLTHFQVDPRLRGRSEGGVRQPPDVWLRPLEGAAVGDAPVGGDDEDDGDALYAQGGEEFVVLAGEYGQTAAKPRRNVEYGRVFPGLENVHGVEQDSPAVLVFVGQGLEIGESFHAVAAVGVPQVEDVCLSGPHPDDEGVGRAREDERAGQSHVGRRPEAAVVLVAYP